MAAGDGRAGVGSTGPGQEPPVADPAVPVVDWCVPNAPDVLAAVDDLWARYTAAVTAGNARLRGGAPASLPTDVDKGVFLHYLKSPQPHPAQRRGLSNRAAVDLPDLLADAAAGPLGVVGAVKFLRLFTGTSDWSLPRVVAAMRRTTGHPTLLEAVALFEPDGLQPRHVLAQWCDPEQVGPDPGPALVHEFFTRFADLVEAAVTTGAGLSWDADRTRLYRGIATQPRIPATTVPVLLTVAFGGRRAERVAAQDALRTVPGIEGRVVAALADGSADVRATAARWLGRLGTRTAVPVLEAALAKERQDGARAAILDALDLLGADTAAHVGRDSLVKEAAKGLARGVPETLARLDLEALPAVRWADGAPVAGDVVRWLLVRAVRARSVEPDAVLRRHCALLDPADRSALGAHLLDAWVAEDTRPVDEAEALRRAREYAGWQAGLSPSEYERLLSRFLAAARREPAGSAIDSKGVLAVAAACGGPWAAPVVARYLEDWYGLRAAQCRALLGMLAWVDDPAAVQTVLATSIRFRTKGIQDEALRLVAALAERRGWTVDELADRTIPACGFDEDGALELDLGSRRFTAQLVAGATGPTVELRSSDGAPLTTLPAARHGDDPDLAAAARKRLAAAKKQVKVVAAQQTARLHEAMCTGRAWPVDDWQRYLLAHPVVRQLARRLVWVEVPDGAQGRPRTFRPLDDGTLTDVDDAAVLLAPGVRVGLAHDALLDPDDVTRWTAHLADYAVAQPFAQIGGGFWALPPDRAGDLALTDFEGHVLEAFALRGRATRLGWTRGPAEDGGVYTFYRKRFASIGLDAVLEFTGNELPEENRTVALVSLGFTRAGGVVTRGSAASVPLAQVPPVLLSQIRGEVASIAAEGAGYDPDWERNRSW